MLTACHTCDHAAACRNCPDIGTDKCLDCSHGNRNKEMPGPYCWTCKRGTEHDDIRIKHSPHNRDELTRSTIQPPSEPCTVLPEEDEDELRRLFSTFTALHPLAVIAARHLARGGTSRTIPAAIENFAAAVRGYRNGMSRATIAAKFLAIGRKLPAAASVRQWPQGHGGRKPKDSQ